MQDVVLTLLEEAGLRIRCQRSDYRPTVSDARFEVKLLKAANIPKLIEYGAHDIGFSGRDWVVESDAGVEILADTGLLPVRIVSAAPLGSEPFATRDRPIVVASEYERLTADYLQSRNVEYRYVRTFGATESFPPEDADVIVDNVATGRTLTANGLAQIDELLVSSTLFLANQQARQDPARRAIIDELQLLVQSVLDARNRVLLDMNVPESALSAVVGLLPAMKSPTVQRLHGSSAYAVRAAVPRCVVDQLIPTLRRAGATDILQTAIERVIA